MAKLTIAQKSAVQEAIHAKQTLQILRARINERVYTLDSEDLHYDLRTLNNQLATVIRMLGGE